MTSTERIGNNINGFAGSKNFEAQLEEYIRFLESRGAVPNRIKKARRCVKHVDKLIRSTSALDYSKSTPETMVWVDSLLSDKTERMKADYKREFGRFLNHVTQSPIYHEDYRQRIGQSFYIGLDDGDTGSFEARLSEYEAYLRENGVSNNIIKDDVKFIRRCMKVLSYNLGEVRLNSMDPSIMEILRTLLSGPSDLTIRRYLRAFGRFMNYHTGTNLYRESTRTISQRDYVGYLESIITGNRFEAELREYMQWMIRCGYRKVTLKNKLGPICNCIERLDSLHPNFALESIDQDMMLELRMSMSELMESTIKHYLFELGQFVERVTGSNPYSKSKLLWNFIDPEREFIHKPEWDRLMAAANPEERLILALGGGMGLRRAEIAEIKLGDIDGNILTIRGKGHGPTGKVVNKEIPTSVQKAIVDYLPFRQRILDLHGDKSEGHLIVKSVCYCGEYMTPDNVGSSMYRLSVRSGVKFSTHSLRRLYATTLYQTGTELNTIRLMMRHSSLDTTLKCYIEADTERMKRAELDLETALFG